MTPLSSSGVLLWETIGTALLIVLGTGVVATVVLRRSKGFDGGWLLITFGWAMGVFVGASVAWRSGAHLNPAVTLGLAISGRTPWAQVPVYFLGQFLGAFIGAVLCWLAFKPLFDEEPHPEDTLGIFSTGPAVRRPVWNMITEVIGTFVLIFWILVSPGVSIGVVPPTLDPSGARDMLESLDLGNNGLGYAGVAFVVLAIGNSLGGPTGYAINPARDLGPRIAYAVLPIRGKGSPDWGYAWVPVVGPLVGATLAALLHLATQGTLM